MIAHPTPILLTTRTGSRSAVLGLNQSQHVRKVEPKRRKAGLEPRPPRIVEPRAKRARPRSPWTDASSLLVILHYLLKNNIRIYECVMCRLRCPRSTFCRHTNSSAAGGI